MNYEDRETKRPVNKPERPAGPLKTHELPPLPYASGALEPFIDARTMELHHGKHHAGYVKKLNAALQDFPELQERSATWLLLHSANLPKKISEDVHNNAGGHVNHSLFWLSMTPAGSGKPIGPLADAIERDFGGLRQFKQEFAKAGNGVFGSGWVWLVRVKNSGKLQVCTTAGHDNPLSQGSFPIIVNDVWEHAYYLKHENRRKEYVDAWWSVVDWREASRRFEKSALPAEQDWENEGGTTKKSSAAADLPEILEELLD